MSLGFNESDAQRLYEEKADWMGINSGGKILCTQQGCKFFTTFGTEALFEHCRVEHNWRDYPCPEENCKFVAYCSYTLKSGITLCFVSWNNNYHVQGGWNHAAKIKLCCSKILEERLTTGLELCYNYAKRFSCTINKPLMYYIDFM